MNPKKIVSAIGGVAICVLLPPLTIASVALSLSFLGDALFPDSLDLMEQEWGISCIVAGLLTLLFVFFTSPLLAGYLATGIWEYSGINQKQRGRLILLSSALTIAIPLLAINISAWNCRVLFETSLVAILVFVSHLASLSTGASHYKRGTLAYFLGKTPYQPGEEPPAQTNDDAKN